MRPQEIIHLKSRLADLLTAQAATDHQLAELRSGQRSIEQALAALNERGKLLTRLGVSIKLSLDELNTQLRQHGPELVEAEQGG